MKSAEDPDDELLGVTASLLQLNTGAEALPHSCIPKVVDAPGAKLPLYDTLTAVAVSPTVVTVAFQADTILTPEASDQVADHFVAGVGAVLATVTVTIAPALAPVPQWLSTCAVALQLPVPPAAAGELPASAAVVPSATSSAAPAVIPHRAKVDRLDKA